ncbi:hypothetical protein B1R32_107173 [Abditibacterium utsteinense]|uniref:Uncharacterized protein n=1 Tax=Abditibacterium utsteinense TaxID=1960156 RepID=A0A2S8STM4_9BACT|nr:hypothetical protein [Abditibacterium utsteinense]PQV64147.1 hypothetical protein B1R32_107173 [Abditibacterium utsteinense]
MKNLIPRAALAFVCLWLFIAVFPPTREVFRAFSTQQDLSRGYFGLSRPSYASVLTQHMEAAQRHPDAPDAALLLSWKQEEEQRDFYSDSPHFRANLREMDELSARFPADLSLPARRLRLSLSRPIYIQTTEAAPKTAAFTKNQILGAADLEAASRIARECEKREPDNAFWPLMDAVFQFVRRQKNAGIEALSRAGQCARYDDYSQSTVRNRVQWLETHANPMWEEKIALQFAVLSPQWAGISVTTKAATLEAVRARKAGNTARTLQIGAAILGACQVLSQEKGELGVLLSHNNARQALEKLFDIREVQRRQLPSGSWPYIDPQIHDTELAHAWANFARKNGRPDLARKASFLLGSQGEETFRDYNSTLWQEFGLRPPLGRVATSAPLLLMFIAALCWLGALLWSIGAMANRWLPNSHASPTRGEVTSCVNFSLWALLGALLVAFRWFLAAQMNLFFLLDDSVRFSVEKMTSLTMAFVLIATIWLFPVVVLVWKRGHRIVRVQKLPTARRRAKNEEVAAPAKPLQRAPRVASWLLFLVFSLAALPNGYDLWDGTLFQAPFSFFAAFVAAIAVLCFEVPRWQRLERRALPRFRIEKIGSTFRAESGALRLFRLGLWLLCPALAFVALTNLPPFLFDRIEMLVPFLLVLGCAIWLEWKGARRDNFLLGLRLSTRSAGVLALLWSVMFIVFCAGLWPLRAELNCQLDRRLQIGEMAWMREQVAAFAPKP